MIKKEDSLLGMLFAVLTYIMWGLLPLYFNLVSIFPSTYVLACRILFSFILVLIIVLIVRFLKLHKLNFYINKKQIFFILLGGIFLSGNWYLYIYAVTHNKILDASLASYMTPLLTTAIGIIFLHEKKTKLEYIAVVLAIVAVMYKTLSLGIFPFLPVIMSLSFSLYGFIKKITHYNSLEGLLLEMSLISIPAAIVIVNMSPQLTDISGFSWFLLSLVAVVTLTPLYTFSKATKRLRVTTIGFFQFITPILSSLVGIFVFKEALSMSTIITFAIVILAVSFYMVSLVIKIKNV